MKREGGTSEPGNTGSHRAMGNMHHLLCVNTLEKRSWRTNDKCKYESFLHLVNHPTLVKMLSKSIEQSKVLKSCVVSSAAV